MGPASPNAVSGIWFFQHHIFMIGSDRSHVRYTRAGGLQGKPVRLKRDCDALIVDGLVVDCVYDVKHKLCFIICTSGEVHVYHYNTSDLTWQLVDRVQLSSSYCRLFGRACCVNSRIYWQTFTDSESQTTSIKSTEYHVKQGCEAGDILSVWFSPSATVLSGCLPCDMIEYKSDTVLALPRYEKTKGIVISIGPVNVIVYDLSCGVIGCHDHLPAPVQFSQISLSILTALQSPQRRGVCVKTSVCDGQRLLIFSSDGGVRQLDTVSETFSKLDMCVPADLLEWDVVLYEDTLAFLDRGKLRCMKLGSNEVMVKADISVESWCYSLDQSCGSVVFLSSDGLAISLKQLLIDSPTSVGGDVYSPPDSMTGLEDKLQAIINESSPGACYSSQLLDILNPNKDRVVETRLSQELGMTMQASRLRLQHSDKKRNSGSTVITVDSIVKLMLTTNQGNLRSRMSSFIHCADVSRRTCLNAFTRFLLQAESNSTAMERWNLFFSLNDQKTSSPPLVSFFLHLVWQLLPESIVDTVLMVGCKYKECLSTASAPSILVDSLLDMIVLPETGLEKGRLLSYCKLCALSSSEYRVLDVVALLRAADVDEECVAKFSGEYRKSPSTRQHLLKQLDASNAH